MAFTLKDDKLGWKWWHYLLIGVGFELLRVVVGFNGGLVDDFLGTIAFAFLLVGIIDGMRIGYQAIKKLP